MTWQPIETAPKDGTVIVTAAFCDYEKNGCIGTIIGETISWVVKGGADGSMSQPTGCPSPHHRSKPHERT